MKIKILTNFIDYYDHVFDNSITDCCYWNRLNIPNFTKIEQFTLLNQLSYKTPLIGNYNFLSKWLKPNDLVMVYLNDKSHNSKDKIVITMNKFELYNVDIIASEFIKQDKKHKECCYKNYKSTSRRDIILNNKIYTLTYFSNHEHFSNFETEKIEIQDGHIDLTWRKTLFPLFAVDAVFGLNFKNELDYYYVDFNTAPEIKNTGIEKILPPNKIYQNVKKWHENNK